MKKPRIHRDELVKKYLTPAATKFPQTAFPKGKRTNTFEYVELFCKLNNLTYSRSDYPTLQCRPS